MAIQVSTLIAFASALLIAACTTVFAYYRYVREQEHLRRTLLNGLFAELATVFEHYAYATVELPMTTTNLSQLRRHLMWSKYGTLRSVNDLGKMGFLDASSMKDVLQLELRIRNDGILLDQLLADISTITVAQLYSLQSRLARRIEEADRLLTQLSINRPLLAQTLTEVKKTLPPLTVIQELIA